MEVGEITPGQAITTSTAPALPMAATYTQSGSIAPTYDRRGNLTSAGTTIYDYTGENRLKTAGPTSLTYDPLGRLTQLTTGTPTTRLGYDGVNMIGEYNGSNAVQRRFVHGPGPSTSSGQAYDQPLHQYEGAWLTDRRWLQPSGGNNRVARSATVRRPGK